MQIYPLKFRPIFKQRIWGGQKLREVFNKDIPPFEKIGESWEFTIYNPVSIFEFLH